MAVIKGPDGQVAGVDDENRLKVFSVRLHEEKDRNVSNGVWSVYFTVTPTGTDDKFFYLKNTGTKDLFITDIRISSSVVTKIFYKHVTGTASAGTDSAITSRNLGNSSVPNATIQHSVDFTGLTDAGVVFLEECSIADTVFHLKTTSNIIVPQGQAVAFERTAATGLIEAVVSVIEAE